MSAKELKKFKIVKEVESGRLTQKKAAKLLNVSDRTVRRWQRVVEQKDAQGLVHGNRGQRSPRKIPSKERNKIKKLLLSRYTDFTPAFATEKLLELHDIKRHRTTIRPIMIELGLWTPKNKHSGKKVVHRQWRERKTHRGELVQFDGSYHDWFEGRGGINEVCLLAAIDDATGQILHLSFAPHEGTLPVMDFWTKYAGIQGLPQAIYLDRFSTYKMTQKVAQENHDLKTQLERACHTLGVELIFALSPQAKGRVERLFQTLQDRLIKELRLHNICSVEVANRFLEGAFISSFNRKYGIDPKDPTDIHRKLSKRELQEIPDTFCRMNQRTIMNDFTISFKSQWYQILPTKSLAIRPKDEVTVREYPDGTLSFSIRNKQALTKPIAKRIAFRMSVCKPTPILVPI